MYDEHTCIKHGPRVARSISKGGRLVEQINRGRLIGPFVSALYLPAPASHFPHISMEIRPLLCRSQIITSKQ